MNELFLSSEIYDEELLAETCRAFRSFAEFRVTGTAGGWHVRMEHPVCPIDLLKNEFENYLIDLSCKRHRW